MTDHEMILLRAAVEACQERELRLEVGPSDDYPGEVYAGTLNYDRDRNGWSKPTLGEALASLLRRDLGADVPEWPSEERVAEIREEFDRDAWESDADSALGRLTHALSLPEYLALRGEETWR